MTNLKSNEKLAFKLVKNYRATEAMMEIYHIKNIDVQDRRGNTLLHWAAATRQLNLCRYLVGLQANLHIHNHDGLCFRDVSFNGHLLGVRDDKENGIPSNSLDDIDMDLSDPLT